MKFFDSIQNWAARTVLGAGQKFSFIQKWIDAAWMDVSFLSLVQNGYRASSAVANCVRALAFSFPEPQLIVYQNTPDGEQPVAASHELQKLIRRPNPDMGEAEFAQFCITYNSVGGNVYIWKERNKAGKVIYLWPFSDKDMAPVPGNNTTNDGIVAYYKFDPGDGDYIYLSKNDVIQWKWMINPEQPWRGIGAVEFAVKDVNNDTESSTFTYKMFKNNAVPPVAITLTEGDELTKEKAKRLRASWMQKYGGDNQGAPAFLEAGMTVQKIGLNMQELDLSELKNIPESRICGAFGVPPSIALLYVGLKRSDYGDGMARKSFTETTLVALWRTYSSEMTASLADEFGGGLTLRHDLSQVRALQENLKELWERINTTLQNGLITRGEARRALGFNSGPEDNVYRSSLISGWEPAGKMPAPLTNADNSGKQAFMSTIQKDRKGHEYKSFAVYARSLQRIRMTMRGAMATDLDSYFGSLADRIVSRAGKALQVMAATKELPDEDDLLTPKDEAELEKLLKRWYVSIAEASWETINLSLGVMVDFELNNSAVTAALSHAGGQVKEITQTTRTALQEALKYGNEQGWSISQLVTGDENQAGIKQIVEETYKNRSSAIARTELGNAQNAVTSERYKANGVGLVEIMDNGDTDDDDECKIANGQIWTVSYFEANPLEHPNCTRAAAPVFDDVVPDKS